ncbi:MAG: Holliday junction branch migration protein RuvA [Acidobacteriota bacterium]
MIGHLEGRIAELAPGKALLEVGGVGYEVGLPLSAHPVLAGRERAALFIHTHVREDQLTLFGFPTRAERDTFRILISVSGVGPRTALALLSGLAPEELAAAVEGEQWRQLAAAPGIGRRTAERLIVDLKGKLGFITPRAAPDLRQDAISALVNLGYPARAAEEAVGELLRTSPDLDLGQLLRQTLKRLGR